MQDLIRQEVEDKIGEIYILIHNIKDLDSLVEEFKNTDLEDMYIEQMLSVIDHYKESHDKLQDTLQKYFEYERENGLNPDFNYHKLAKVLKNTRV